MSTPFARIALVTGLLLSATAHSQADGSAEPEKRGYWWYQEPPAEIPPEQQEHQPLGPPPDEATLSKLEPDEFQALLTDYFNNAMVLMTEDAVAQYYELQDFARRRARMFMNVTGRVMLDRPELNMNTVYPTTAPGMSARTAQRYDEFAQRFAQEQHNAALVLLTRKSCPYCPPQRATLKSFQQKYQWNVREYDLDERPDLVAQFGVQTTPTTVVLTQSPHDWNVVAVGVTSEPELEQQVYSALRFIRGEIDIQSYSLKTYEDGSPLDPRRP